MTSLPQPLVKRVALLFGLAGLCLGAAIALTAGRIASHGGDVLASMDRTSADVTGSIGSAGARLPLTDEQRGHIFDGIMKLRDAPVADVPAPDAIAALPGSVPLQELPASVTLEVVEADPVVRGQTASSSYKPAILSNGVRTNVPPHIGAGTRIVVMTEDGSYVERAKD